MTYQITSADWVRDISWTRQTGTENILVQLTALINQAWPVDRVLVIISNTVLHHILTINTLLASWYCPTWHFSHFISYLLIAITSLDEMTGGFWQNLPVVVNELEVVSVDEIQHNKQSSKQHVRRWTYFHFSFFSRLPPHFPPLLQLFHFLLYCVVAVLSRIDNITYFIALL